MDVTQKVFPYSGVGDVASSLAGEKQLPSQNIVAFNQCYAWNAF